MKHSRLIIARTMITLFIALSLVLTGCSDSGVYNDGIYSGEGSGHHGKIMVSVTIKGGDIDSIKVVENPENKVLSASAFETLTKKMISTNSGDVDAISGASDSSRGFIDAVEDALSQCRSGELVKSDKKNSDLIVQESETVQNYDIVVIGAGGAGLTAGVTAAETGASVLIIEKMPAPGGNTLVSGGEFNVPGSWKQKEEGVEDSIALYMEDTLKGGDYKADPALVSILAENAIDAAIWLKDDIKLIFDDHLFQFGGHSVPRALFSKGGSGEQMILKLIERGESLGMVLKTNTKALSLIQGTDGSIVGVKASNLAGQDLRFNASKAVIIASGGFGSSLEMRNKYNADYGDEYMSTGQPGITGDGIKMAQDVNADVVGMEYIQTYPACSPKTGILSYVADNRFFGAILVNKEGERFVNELGRRDTISRQILAQTGRAAYLLWDSNIESISGMSSQYSSEYNELDADKLICKVESLDEAADFFGVDINTLKASVASYNKNVASGEDTQFGNPKKRGIIEPPFYLEKVAPSVHHTMGGLVIDTDAHVYDKDGNKIPNLFACGEVTGGIHGTNRLGGNAISDLLVFGRIAGTNAASN